MAFQDRVLSIEFTENNGTGETTYLAIFNKKQITEQEVRSLITNGTVHDRSDVIVEKKEKWNRIMR